MVKRGLFLSIVLGLSLYGSDALPSSLETYWINPSGRELFESALRTQPDTQAPYFPCLGGTQRLVVVNEQADWVQVQFEDGRTAWIMAPLLNNRYLLITSPPHLDGAMAGRLKEESARCAVILDRERQQSLRQVEIEEEYRKAEAIRIEEEAAQRAAKLKEEARRREEAARLRREIEEQARKAELARVSGINAQSWSQEIKKLTIARKIAKGMQPEMVILSMGEPHRRIETDIGKTREETLIYHGGLTLFFVNDVLVGWRRER